MQRPELFSQTLGAPLRAYLEKSLAVRLPWTRDLGGQFGLDAGCGEGRYLYLMTETGAEVVGMDLGNSVDFAYGRNRDNARSHVVQASIFQPPFREGVFDFFFSIGVLHHLPDPEAGFAALVPLLKEGGSAMIWVYGLTDMNQIYQLSHLTAVRPLTSRLSPRATYAAAVPIATALELFAFAPVRLLSHLAAVSERIPPQLQEVSELPFTTKIAEVHDRIGAPVTFFPTYEDLDGWFSRAHLEGVEILKTSGSRGWSARGFRSARSAEPVLPQAPASNGT
jgi:SAM-dependent methyltransferase